MTARIIDGKAIAADLRSRVAAEVARVKRENGLTPGLAVVLVGNDPASEVYVRSKHTQTQAAGRRGAGRSAGADRNAQPRSGRARHSGAAAAAEIDQYRDRHQRHRSSKG